MTTGKRAAASITSELFGLARAIVVRLVGCRHRRMYRERRSRFGAEIWHFVCPECGHVVPMVNRTEAETRALGARASDLRRDDPDVDKTRIASGRLAS